MPAKKTNPNRVIRVAVSHNGFDLGEKFVADPADRWVAPLIEAGYMEVLDESPQVVTDGDSESEG